MIRSAREVLVLADHTAFGAEVGFQIAPVKAAYRLITHDALPPSTRLEMSKAGIKIVLAYINLVIRSTTFSLPKIETAANTEESQDYLPHAINENL